MIWVEGLQVGGCMQLPMLRGSAPQACDDENNLYDGVPFINVLEIWRESSLVERPVDQP